MKNPNRIQKLLLSLFVAGSLLSLCSGCIGWQDRVKLNLKDAHKKVTYYKDPAAKDSIHRVLLMPVVNLSRQKFNGDDFYREMVLMFSKYSYFEVMTAEHYPEEMINTLASFYRVKKARTEDSLD